METTGRARSVDNSEKGEGGIKIVENNRATEDRIANGGRKRILRKV